MTNIHFCSFGDARLQRSLKRIASQAEEMRAFASILVIDESGLDADFQRIHAELLVPGSRGYGYWVWKPQLLKQAFAKANVGDLILYADCGCWLNSAGSVRLKEYFEIVKNSESGIGAFCIPSNRPSELAEFSYPEYVWTKGDLFKYFDVQDLPDIYISEQFVSTAFILRKEKRTEEFLDAWAKVWKTSIDLINDEPSKHPNFNGFIEHRHDQSAFSILCKLYEAEKLPYVEIEYPVLTSADGNFLDGKSYYLDWNVLRDMPIHARRDKDLGYVKKLYIRVRNRLFRGLKKSIAPSKKIWGLGR